MKSTAPWSVKGIERDARERAKDAARREGVTLGEWLNRVIYVVGEEDKGLSVLEGDALSEAAKIRDLAAAIARVSEHVAKAENAQEATLDDVARKMGGAVERIQRLEQSGTRNARIEEALLRLAEADQSRTRSIKALETAVTHIATQFNKAQKQTANRFDVLETSNKGATEDGVAGAAIPSAFIESVDERFRVLGDEIRRTDDRSKAIEESVTGLSSKIEDAENRSAVAIERLTETMSVLRDDLKADRSNDETIERHVRALAEATESQITALQRSFYALVDKIDPDAAPAPSRGPSRGPAVQPSVVPDSPEQSVEPIHVASFEEVPSEDEPINDVPAVADLSEFADPFADFDTADEIDGDEHDQLDATDPDTPHDDLTGFGQDSLQPDNTQVVGQALEASHEQSGSVESSSDQATDDLDAIMAELDALGFGDDEEETSSPAPLIEDRSDPLDELPEDDGFEPVQSTVSPSLPVSNAAPLSHDTDASHNDQTGARSVAEAPSPSSDLENPLSQATTAPSEQGSSPQGGVDTEETTPATPQKRRLTPRQRAVLQAKIKRKRLAEVRARRGLSPTGAAPIDAPDDNLFEPREAVETSDPSSSKSGDNIAALQAGVKDGLGRLKKALGIQSADQTDTHEPAFTDEENNERFDSERSPSKPRSGLTSKPVTVALGAGVVLTGATLTFMLRDQATEASGPANKPSNNLSIASATASPTTPNATPSELDGSTVGGLASPGLTDPSLSSLSPRELFVKGLTDLTIASNDTDTGKALELIQQAAALGHPPAQLQLGELYKLGQSVDRDLEVARSWYRRAANGGNVLAMHRLGVMSARGEGGPVDTTQSVAWFEKAAGYGLVNSMYNLGATFHPTGDGGGTALQDPEKSYFWYSIAAQNGDEQAAKLAASMASNLDASSKSAADQRIAAWTAEQRDPEANERFGA